MASLIERAQAVAMETFSALPSRRAHVTAVAATTESISGHLSLSGREAVVASAWLHDIGYAEHLAVTSFHPVDGASFVRNQGFPETVVSLVAYHTGAETEASERGLLDALAAFGRPDPALLDVLTFSDLTVGPEGEPVDAEARIAEILSRYPDGHPVNRGHGAVLLCPARDSAEDKTADRRNGFTLGNCRARTTISRDRAMGCGRGNG